MLEFKQDDTDAELILTLTELTTISPVNYLFVFTHVLTKNVVAFIPTDVSEFTDRYNQFFINPSVLFADQPPGEWHYDIYQQDSNSNLDPSQAGAIVEYGKMILDRAADFAYDMYDSPTSYKTYNG